MQGFNPDKQCKILFKSDCGKKKCTIEFGMDSQTNQVMATPLWEPELIPGSKMELYASLAINYLMIIQNGFAVK